MKPSFDNLHELDREEALAVLRDEMARAKNEPERIELVNGELRFYNGRKRISCPPGWESSDSLAALRDKSSDGS